MHADGFPCGIGRFGQRNQAFYEALLRLFAEKSHSPLLGSFLLTVFLPVSTVVSCGKFDPVVLLGELIKITLKEILFPAQRLRKSIPRPLIWIGILLAMLLCFALFFHPASLGNVVRDFSTTEKVHIVNYYTVATSHLPPQKEGELSFSYTDTEKQEAFLEILDRYVLFKSPNQTYGGIGEEVYRLAIDLTDAHGTIGHPGHHRPQHGGLHHELAPSMTSGLGACTASSFIRTWPLFWKNSLNLHGQTPCKPRTVWNCFFQA